MENYGTYADGVVGWVKVTGRNLPIGTTATAHVADAIRAADQYVNFQSYYTNRNSRLEPNELHVTVIAAGKGGLSSGVNWGVW